MSSFAPPRSAVITGARQLLKSENLDVSDAAKGDLDSGRVDPRLVAVLGPAEWQSALGVPARALVG